MKTDILSNPFEMFQSSRMKLLEMSVTHYGATTLIRMTLIITTLSIVDLIGAPNIKTRMLSQGILKGEVSQNH
jgi:hypothetical protein